MEEEAVNRDSSQEGELNADSPSFFQAGGALERSAPSYIVRSADEELIAAIERRELCFILDTRQIGKTSLLARACHHLREMGWRVCVLDVTALGRELGALEWYRGILFFLMQSLGQQPDATEYWNGHAHLGPCQRLFSLLRDVYLTGDDAPLLLVVDEIDALRALPFSTAEFLAAIREFYQRRVHDPLLSGCAFLLAGSATPSQLIPDERITPFNVGRRIELADFTRAEMQPLARGLRPYVRSARDSERVLDRVLYWTNGHPYLTQFLCRDLTAQEGYLTPAIVDARCRHVLLSGEARETDDNLAFVRDRIQGEADPTAALLLYRKLRSGQRITYAPRDSAAAALRLAGLAVVRDGRLALRNRVYHLAFDDRWIAEQLPGQEIRRQRQAFRAGILRASAAWAGALSLAGAAIWWNQEAYAEHSRAEAEAKEKRLAFQKNQQLETQIAAATRSLSGIRADARQETKKVNLLEKEERQKEQALGGLRAAMSAAERRRNEAEYALKRADTALLSERSRADAAGTRATEAALRVAEENRKLERLNGRIASSLSFERGQEFEAIRYGLKAVEPALRSGQEPGREALQGLVDAVSTGIVRRLRVRHSVPVTALAASPDGRQFVVGTKGALVFLHDSKTGRILKTFWAVPPTNMERAGCTTYSVDFSPDGRRILTASDEVLEGGRRLLLWDIAPDVEEAKVASRELFLADAQHATGAFATKQPGVYSSLAGESVGYWPLAGNDQGLPFGSVTTASDRQFLWAVAPSPTGSLVAGSGRTSGLHVWDVPSGRQIAAATTAETGGEVLTLHFRDDTHLLYGGKMGGPILWDLASNRKQPFRQIHQDWVWGVDTSPDTNLVASASRDGSVCLWTPRPGAPPLFVLKTHVGIVYDVRFLAGGQEIVTAGSDCTDEVWHLTLPILCRNGDSLTTACYSRTGGRMALASEDGTVEVRDPAAGKRILVHNAASVVSVSLNEDGSRLATGDREGQVRLWQLSWGASPKASLIRQFAKMAGGAAEADLSWDGRLLAASGWEHLIVWETETGKVTNDYTWGGTNFGSVRFLPDGRVLATRNDGIAALYDLRHKENGVNSWRPESREFLHQQADFPFDADCTADRNFVATAERNGTIYLWDGYGSKSRSPDSPYGGFVRPIAELKGHGGQVNAVRFSPDGRTLASAGQDGTVRLWSKDEALAARGLGRAVAPLLTIKGHLDSIPSVCFSPDGKWLLTASRDGTARLFPATAAGFVQEAKRILALEGEAR